MKDLKGKVAAVTGAASGIGRMLAVNLAKEGCRLALADIDRDGLGETSAMIGALGNGTPVSVHPTDVSRRGEVERFAEEAVRRHGGVDLVVNNAGVALGDLLETVPLADFEWLMGVNFWGVVHGTTAFLPHLRRRPEGHIVNVSSLYGILPAINNGPYTASKFAVRGYTETLAQELRGTGIRVSCVYPAGIRTGIARNARFNRALYGMDRETARELYEEKLFTITPDEAARTIISGIRRNRRRIFIGLPSRLADLAMRFLPGATLSLSAWVSDRVARYFSEKQKAGKKRSI